MQVKSIRYFCDGNRYRPRKIKTFCSLKTMYLIIFTSIKKKEKKTECDIFLKKGKLKKVQDI